MKATIPIKAGVVAGTLQGLRDLVDAERARFPGIIDIPVQVGGDMTHRERAARRAARAAHLDDLRSAGILLDSINVCVTAAAQGELARRGWTSVLPAPPPEALLPERRLGSRTRSYAEVLQARLPAALVAQVQAACWHHSREAVEQIRQLHDRHSRGSIYQTPALLARYNELADQVTTAGDLYRAAVAGLLDRRLRDMPG